MVITLEMIITICTSIVTYIFGILVKKFDIMESKYIPFQNLAIGILAGVIAYLMNIGDLLPCVIYCLAGSLGAGGFYDALSTQRGE